MDLSTDAGNIPKKVVDTYKTSGFDNEGVKGSTPCDTYAEYGKQPITPLPGEFGGSMEHIAHKNVTTKGATEADGVASDEGKVKARGVVDTHQ